MSEFYASDASRDDDTSDACDEQSRKSHNGAQDICSRRATRRFKKICRQMARSSNGEVEHVLAWDLKSATSQLLIAQLRSAGFTVTEQPILVCQGLLINHD